MGGSDYFIEAINLTKVYDNGIIALDNLTFNTKARILGLIGPNGAGKTTFVRIATGLLKPTKGAIRVLGISVTEKLKEIKKRISLVPQDVSPDSRATVYEHVVYYLVARGYSLSEAKKRAREVLELFDLWDLRNITCLRLSGGQRKLVIIAAALAPYEVEAVFLDEPTTGLDPANRIKFWGLMSRMTKEGIKVLVTTHEMEEVEEHVEEVIMINKGKLILHDKPQNILSFFKNKVCLDILEPNKFYNTFKDSASLRFIEKIVDLGTAISVYVHRDAYEHLLDILCKHGIEFKTRRCTLKDAFLWWTS